MQFDHILMYTVFKQYIFLSFIAWQPVVKNTTHSNSFCLLSRIVYFVCCRKELSETVMCVFVSAAFETSTGTIALQLHWVWRSLMPNVEW